MLRISSILKTVANVQCPTETVDVQWINYCQKSLKDQNLWCCAFLLPNLTVEYAYNDSTLEAIYVAGKLVAVWDWYLLCQTDATKTENFRVNFSANYVSEFCAVYKAILSWLSNYVHWHFTSLNSIHISGLRSCYDRLLSLPHPETTFSSWRSFTYRLTAAFPFLFGI
jgi:hypothetical protein